ncbi:hypothetical protein BST36_29115 [Mycolicibacterium moriokaense]|uniref:Uncharacterized protein n=1 Tax=Mycolicibacterium moriokaense TaxID=39691 RepID=A0AAD1M6P5_9MYCO|nr:hypothetical protein [Mycolicibacterium moriokaense]MCV7037111.1 hypothetical protein [Mycolicibacterium moriokaense]ORB13802.1 hypothetical protein BST36_29115 [Mycolicibacterium moriokaense]BBX02268.1 hypothetical protein MMOR_32040 [Mycolicibacterium moriokaense]
MTESGFVRVDRGVVLSGLPLKAAYNSALIAAKARKQLGGPYQIYEALACQFAAAMAADGHSDVPSPPIREADAVEQPTVPIADAAVALGISLRQTRRLAPRLGGRKVAGCWFVDEAALREHIEGRSK